MIKSTQPLEIQTWLAKFATPGVQRYLVISEASLVQKGDPIGHSGKDDVASW